MTWVELCKLQEQGGRQLDVEARRVFWSVAIGVK